MTKEFTQDWFSHNIPSWKKHLVHLMGQPELTTLEIGSFEGRSACWIMDNICSHETSRLICIDRWEYGYYLGNRINCEGVEARFDRNTAEYGQRLKKIKAASMPTLAGWVEEGVVNKLDLIYVDGGHEAANALQDLVLCWPMLKPGGILVFDDYQYKHNTVKIRPGVALDAFLSCHRDFKVLHQAYQKIVKKC